MLIPQYQRMHFLKSYYLLKGQVMKSLRIKTGSRITTLVINTSMIYHTEEMRAIKVNMNVIINKEWNVILSEHGWLVSCNTGIEILKLSLVGKAGNKDWDLSI